MGDPGTRKREAAVMADEITVTPRLYEWLKRSESRSVKAAMENDLAKPRAILTRNTSQPPVIDGEDAAGPG